MKIYESKSPAEGFQGHYGAYTIKSNFICELGSNIKLFTQLHTKDTLAPIFGKILGFYGSSSSAMLLHNSIQKPRDYEDLSEHHADSAYGGEANFVGTSNRQIQMAGLTMTRMWRSTYDTTKIYFTSKYDYNHGHSYNYEFDVTTNTVTNFYQDPTHMGAIGFIYEDEDYLWGVDNGGDYLYDAYANFVRVHKGTLNITRVGYRDRTSFLRPLYWNDEYIISFWDDGNYSGGHPSRCIHLNKWNDTMSDGTALYWKDQSANNWYYPFLEMQQSDGTKARKLIYHLNPLTDDTPSKAGGSDASRPHWSQPALVHDNAGNLRDTHKVIRTYHAERCDNGVLGIIRCNIPLLDHANAFNDASDGRPGGKAYGTSENPTYDVRNCNISALAGFSTPLSESNMFGNNGKIYSGNTSHIYKAYHLSFFEDSNGKGFLILDFADPKAHMHDAGATYRAQSIWVFEIENYAASITDELWETNSLDLKIIQEIDTGDDLFGLYRPNDDPETFIAMSWRNNSHKIYTWNSSSKQFTTGSELKGQIEAIGNDSSGNIYTIKCRGGNRNYEIHAESPTLPNQIVVTPANDRYTFTGANISSTVDIECFNYAGDRIAATVNLQMIGEGVIFTSSSATSAGKALTITTSSSAAVTENISITEATFVKINASMSI